MITNKQHTFLKKVGIKSKTYEGLSQSIIRCGETSSHKTEKSNHGWTSEFRMYYHNAQDKAESLAGSLISFIEENGWQCPCCRGSGEFGRLKKWEGFD